MKLSVPALALSLALLFSTVGCESLKPAPERKGKKGRQMLKAPQTGSNIRKLEKAPFSSASAKPSPAKPKRSAEAKPKREKPAAGVADETYVPRGGFR